MKKRRSVVFYFLIALTLVNTAHANLNLIGQGTSAHGTYNLVYDTDLDITWYDYTRPNDTWWNQRDWAIALSVNFGGNVYNDWRLPITFDQHCDGFNCTNSEMGRLYYTELGNTADTGGYTNSGDFQNLQPVSYWSGTQFLLYTAPIYSWDFLFSHGYQDISNKDSFNGYAIAVRSGMAVVPEPISSILFVTGGSLLAVQRHLRRKKAA